MIVVKILRMEAVVEDSMMLIPTAFSRHSLVEEWEVWAEWVAIWEVILSSFLVPLVMVRASASNLAKKSPCLVTCLVLCYYTNLEYGSRIVIELNVNYQIMC